MGRRLWQPHVLPEHTHSHRACQTGTIFPGPFSFITSSSCAIREAFLKTQPRSALDVRKVSQFAIPSSDRVWGGGRRTCLDRNPAHRTCRLSRRNRSDYCAAMAGSGANVFSCDGETAEGEPVPTSLNLAADLVQCDHVDDISPNCSPKAKLSPATPSRFVSRRLRKHWRRTPIKIPQGRPCRSVAVRRPRRSHQPEPFWIARTASR